MLLFKPTPKYSTKKKFLSRFFRIVHYDKKENAKNTFSGEKFSSLHTSIRIE